MFPPVPDVFAGSLPPDKPVPPDAHLPTLLDRALAALALISGAAAAIGLSLGGAALAAPDAAKLIFAATLLPALLGMWLLEQVQDAPNLAVTRIYSLVQHRLRTRGGPLAVARHPHEDSYGGLAGLIADSVANLRGLQAGRARAQGEAAAVTLALETGRLQAGALALTLRKDAAAMADAASGIMAASARLVEDANTTREGSQTAQNSVTQVVTRATTLAEAVATMTVQIRSMAASASSAAQCAFGAHAGVAALVDRTAALSRSAEAASRALVDAQADPAHAIAQTIQTAIASMQATVAGLRTELDIAVRNVVELSDVIQNQQDAGTALSHAVDRQGTEIRQVLMLLQETHAGLDRVRAGVDGLSRHGADRQAEAETIRGTANRLPAHADLIAGILRNIPDFSPSLET